MDNTSTSPSVGVFLPFTAEVVDTTPPEMTFTVLTDTLWPPNHKMALAAEVTDVSDAHDRAPIVNITVTSNESIDGPGASEPDWDVVQVGKVWQIWLRAARDQGSSGRDYYIDVVVSDFSGNQSTASGTVSVAKRGRKK
jgi:hypothetical protein